MKMKAFKRFAQVAVTAIAMLSTSAMAWEIEGMELDVAGIRIGEPIEDAIEKLKKVNPDYEVFRLTGDRLEIKDFKGAVAIADPIPSDYHRYSRNMRQHDEFLIEESLDGRVRTVSRAILLRDEDRILIDTFMESIKEKFTLPWTYSKRSAGMGMQYIWLFDKEGKLHGRDFPCALHSMHSLDAFRDENNKRYGVGVNRPLFYSEGCDLRVEVEAQEAGGFVYRYSITIFDEGQLRKDHAVIEREKKEAEHAALKDNKPKL